VIVRERADFSSSRHPQCGKALLFDRFQAKPARERHSTNWCPISPLSQQVFTVPNMAVRTVSPPLEGTIEFQYMASPISKTGKHPRISETTERLRFGSIRLRARSLRDSYGADAPPPAATLRLRTSKE
jgi:hypothetical protein